MFNEMEINNTVARKNHQSKKLLPENKGRVCPKTVKTKKKGVSKNNSKSEINLRSLPPWHLMREGSEKNKRTEVKESLWSEQSTLYFL